MDAPAELRLPWVALSLLAGFISAAAAAASNGSYVPRDNKAVNCGGPGTTALVSGRSWAGDEDPSRFIRLDGRGSSSAAAAAATQDYAPQVPYMTARISKSRFAYHIPVSSGGHMLLRLHFHPASYSAGARAAVDAADAFFSVTVNGGYALLRNFSASLFASALRQTYFFKEFLLAVPLDEKHVTVSFAPSPGSSAFVNGVEVVSMPEDLYYLRRDVGVVGVASQTFPIADHTAMETLYRLNVNGQSVSPTDDAGRMFRAWPDDQDEIFGAAVGEGPYDTRIKIRFEKVPPFTAPEILYKTARSMGVDRTVNENYNLTWRLPVDSGFVYLVRLHFCEIAPEITRINQRVFQIFLNNQTADSEMDIIARAGGSGVPIYREFAVIAPSAGAGKRQDMWLALHPAARSRTEYSDALLNGLEILKMNDSDGSLAGSNPDPLPGHGPARPSEWKRVTKPRRRIRLLPLVVAAAVLCGGVAVSSLFYFLYWRRTLSKGGGVSRLWCPFSPSESEFTKDLPWDRCRHFSLQEIRSATDGFSDDRVIGAGGFGKVYGGEIDGGDGDRKPRVAVAIKRLNPLSQQGAHEFRTEIEMLSQLRHRHLVSLIGYCDDDREMILVYDHMARGALRDYLYNTAASAASSSGSSSSSSSAAVAADHPLRLPWKQRLEICIGAARGLEYLHTGGKHPIIHRDVKTTNILLDERWVAKVSDFGLSRVGPSNVSRTHVSTEVKGSFGYLDPEYYRRQQLTDKSDVYSFGVVLYEVLCGRPPLDRRLAKDELCLSEWARAHHAVGSLDRIVDPSLRDEVAPECLQAFGGAAYGCLLDRGADRPSMSDVVAQLELAMRLQEGAAAAHGGSDRDYSGRAGGGLVHSGGWAGDSGTRVADLIFSELMSPAGR